MKTQSNSQFTPFTFKNGMSLRNRIAMAPMTTWSANSDGTISDEELAYYQARAKGIGMIITGCTHVMENGIGFEREFAAHDDRFIPSLTKLAASIKIDGATAILQIFHAGNKALESAEMVSPSAVRAIPGPFNSGNKMPKALSDLEIFDLVKAFGDAARRAIKAGFDGVEIHGAHGFLLQSFFSPNFNTRNDIWGGSTQNRMNFAMEVLRSIRREANKHSKTPFLIGYRISPEENIANGYKLEDTLKLIDSLIDEGVDYVHISTRNVLSTKVIGSESDLIVEAISKHVDGCIPVMAAGSIDSPSVANRALDKGLDLVAIGKGLLINPDWISLAEQGEDSKIQEKLDRDAKERLFIPSGLWKAIESTEGWVPIKGSCEFEA